MVGSVVQWQSLLTFPAIPSRGCFPRSWSDRAPSLVQICVWGRLGSQQTAQGRADHPSPGTLASVAATCFAGAGWTETRPGDSKGVLSPSSTSPVCLVTAQVCEASPARGPLLGARLRVVDTSWDLPQSLLSGGHGAKLGKVCEGRNQERGRGGLSLYSAQHISQNSPIPWAAPTPCFTLKLVEVVRQTLPSSHVLEDFCRVNPIYVDPLFMPTLN